MTNGPMDRIVAALRTVAGDDDAPVVELAGRVGIGGMIARRLGIALPEAPRVARALRERLLRDAARDIGAQLARAGIPHFGARGIVLGGTIYALGDRDLADVDLYVPPETASHTTALLMGMGFTALPASEQSGPDTLRASVALERSHPLDDTHIDLHWGVEPVDYLLPRAEGAIPAAVWQHLEPGDPLPRPAPAHHAALLVHHVVHHDFLHFRGLVDLLQLRATSWNGDGDAFAALATAWGVRRVAMLLHDQLVREFGFPPVPGVAPAPRDWRSRRLRRLLVPEAWLRLVREATPREHAAITPRRLARRLLALDRITRAPALFGDVLFPPRAHLSWRWPEARTVWGAWWHHLSHTVSRAIR